MGTLGLSKRLAHSSFRRLLALVVVWLACALLLGGCNAAGQSVEAPLSNQAPVSDQALVESEQADAVDIQEASLDEQDGETTASRRAELYGGALVNKTMQVSADDAALHSVKTPEPKSTRYTVMVYMVGSNLESMNGAATDDLGEMLESGIDFSQANVIVYAGGSRRWNTNIPMSCNSVLDLSRAGDDRIVAQTTSNVSMGSPQTLSAFVNYCADNYPAKHNALVFWDHGGGPLWGYGFDELNAGDSLLLPELRQAMEETPYKASNKRKLDWVGFDACLMGSLESAALWADYAGWLVASEEVEPGDGWDYSFLSFLNGSTKARAIGERIVDAYAAHYAARANEFSNPDITLAVYDLSKAEAAVDALDVLSDAMTAGIEAGGYGALNRARRNVKAFGLSAVDSREAGYDLADVDGLAAGLHDLYPSETDALSRAVRDLVAHSSANVEGACGVSMYFPGENRELFEVFAQLDAAVREGADAGDASDSQGTDVPVGGAGAAVIEQAGEASASDVPPGEAPADVELSAGAPADDLDARIAMAVRAGLADTSLSPAYDAFVDSYAKQWFAASEVDWTLAEPQSGADGVSLQLTDEQAEAVSSVTYAVLNSPVEEGRYGVLTNGVQIAVEDDNKIHVPVDPIVIGARSDLDSSTAGYFKQVASSGGVTTYTSKLIFLEPAGEFTDIDLSVDENVIVTIDVSETGDGGSDVTVKSINADAGEIGAGGKNEVNVSRYSKLVLFSMGLGYLVPKYGKAGESLPCDEWPNSGGYFYKPLSLQQGFRFIAQPASRFGGNFSCQIIVTDVNGVQHATEPVSLQTSQDQMGFREVVQETPLGSITYAVANDHAELSQYKGDDWTIELPTQVEGVPLTHISDRAFRGCSYLDELVVPEGVRSIGARAFAFSGLFSLTLPSTLESVGSAAFMNMSHLKEFTLSDSCAAFTVKDGILFSSDGKTLVAYPKGKGDSYDVPPGTEVIGFGAFGMADMKRIGFPEGLRVIERAACYGCSGLSQVELPKSLEEIGTLAFGGSFKSGWEASQQPTIVIGPHVTYVGSKAFSGLDVRSIEVDSANEHYQGKGGMLLNAAGDAIVAAPLPLRGVVGIPEGVASIPAYAFEGYPDTAEFIVPASVHSIDPDSFPNRIIVDPEMGEEVSSYPCKLHVTEGSYAERFAQEYDMSYDNVTDRELLEHTRAEVEQGAYRMLFWEYADHAVLVSVDGGTDSPNASKADPYELQVPGSVDGLPVTGIDIGNDRITDPDGAVSVDRMDDVETLVVPAELQTIGPEGLSSLSGLKRIKLDGENRSFELRDGVLFTADGETLVAYPAKREGAYEVPDGVEQIASKAFYGAEGLTSIVLPDSLRVVANNAFFECNNLVSVQFGSGLESVGDRAFGNCFKLHLDAPFPNSLAHIGKYAFSALASYEGLAIPEGIEWIGDCAFRASVSDVRQLSRLDSSTIKIGSRCRYVGFDAFNGLGVKAFEVSEDNKVHRSEGPFLLSADRRTLEMCASGFDGEAWLPDGVKTIGAFAFSKTHAITGLHIPASVQLISDSWLEDGSVPNVRVYVKAGSYAERFAQRKGLSWEVEQ